MSKSKQKAKNRINERKITYIGGGLYGGTIVLSILLLLIEPQNLDYKALITPVIIILFAGSLGLNCSIATKNSSRTLAVAGIFAMSLLFTLVGTFIIAGIAWLIALSHI